MRRSRSRRRGIAAFLAIATVFLVAAAGAAALDLAVRRSRGAALAAAQLRLRALDDAAGSFTVARLAADPSYAGTPPRPFAGGTFSSRVARNGESWRVETAASLGASRRSSVLVVERRPSGALAVRTVPKM